MKSILYVGATLMIGASIYGFVDYKQTSSKKGFANMYSEEKSKEAELINNKKVEGPLTKKEEMILTEKKEVVKKDLFAGAKAVKNIVSKRKTAAKKKKYFNRKMFSRGALDERYIEPKKIEEVKTETKKTEEKGQ